MENIAEVGIQRLLENKMLSLKINIKLKVWINWTSNSER